MLWRHHLRGKGYSGVVDSEVSVFLSGRRDESWFNPRDYRRVEIKKSFFLPGEKKIRRKNKKTKTVTMVSTICLWESPILIAFDNYQVNLYQSKAISNKMLD